MIEVNLRLIEVSISSLRSILLDFYELVPVLEWFRFNPMVSKWASSLRYSSLIYSKWNNLWWWSSEVYGVFDKEMSTLELSTPLDDPFVD